MFYRKKRKRGRVAIVTCTLLLLVVFTYGYISNTKPQNKPNNITEKELNNKIVIDKQAEKDKAKEDDIIKSTESDTIGKGDEIDTINIMEKVNENSQIVFNKYYVKTGETETTKTKIPITIVGATLNEFKAYIESNYSDWIIRSVSAKSASLFKQIEGYKPNDFLIQSKDGYIMVYKINESGEKELYEKTEISVSTLGETDKRKLEEGIIVKSLEDVYNLIEDYSS